MTAERELSEGFPVRKWSGRWLLLVILAWTKKNK